MTETNKYLKSKIYKVVSDCTNDVYIGSTYETLNSRFSKHKNTMKRYNNGLCNYSTVNKILPFDDVKILLIEDYPCQNKKELLSREAYWIKNIPNTVNKYIPLRTRKEYYEENKTFCLEIQKVYKEKNKQKIKEYQRTYRQRNDDKIKQYIDKNKQKIKDRQKQYRDKNKQKIKDRQKQVCVCTCGCNVSRSNLTRHKKSRKHFENIKQIQTDITNTLNDMKDIFSRFEEQNKLLDDELDRVFN